jgi:hypothetical protein
MAKGDLQAFIPGWNVYYMIKNWWQDRKKIEAAEKKYQESVEESRALLQRIDALKFERAHQLIMGNKERADEIDRELNDIALKQLNKLLKQ